MSTLGEINWDFHLLTMKFIYLGKTMFLQGLRPSDSTILEADRFLNDSARKGLVLQLSPANSATAVQPQIQSALFDLLNEFSKVFEVPSSLPPIRGHEHSITLRKVLNQYVKDHTGSPTSKRLKLKKL